MKRRVNIFLLSAAVLMSGCESSARDGVYLIMGTAEAGNAPKALPERQSSESCPDTAEGSAETTDGTAETDGVSLQTDEVSHETEESPRETALPETEETAAVPAVQPPEGYITETSRFSGTLTGSDSVAYKLEITIDIPFGKKCAVGGDGRVHIEGADWYEDNSVYAYFADYEYYTEDIIAEMLEGERSDDWLIDMRAEKALTDDGEEFYIQISRFYGDESYADLSSVIVDGIYILDNGHHLSWSYIDRGELDFDDFISDAVKSLKSAEYAEYIPDQAEIDQAELDAITDALIQAGEIQTEFPWRAASTRKPRLTCAGAPSRTSSRLRSAGRT